jgi:hypothetical protein
VERATHGPRARFTACRFRAGAGGAARRRRC